MATREETLKAELLILTKLGQLEGRRRRAIAHSLQKHNEKYDEERRKFLVEHPEVEEVLVKDGDLDHATYLHRVKERAQAAAEAAAKQAALPVTEEVSDNDLIVG